MAEKIGGFVAAETNEQTRLGFDQILPNWDWFLLSRAHLAVNNRLTNNCFSNSKLSRNT